MKRWLGLFVVGVLIAGCGGAGAPTSGHASTRAPAKATASTPAASPAPATATVTFQTDFLPTGWDVGYWVALKQGFYKQQKLDVKAQTGKGSFQTAEDVAKGNEDFGQVDGGTLVQAIDQGLPAIGVASLFTKSPAAIIVPASSPIRSIADLRGKTIAENASDATAHMLPGVLAYNHLSTHDVKLDNVANSALVPALLRHRVDAILTLAVGLGVVANVKGMPTRNLLFDDNGMHLPGYALAANRAFAQAHPGVVRRFILATRQGWQWARQHPAQAVAILRQAFPTAPENVLSRELKLSFSFWQQPPATVFDLQQYAAGQRELVKYGVIKQPKPIGELVTNAYVPK